MNMMSMIGRRPVAAAPTPRPTMPVSEIGRVDDAVRRRIPRAGPRSNRRRSRRRADVLAGEETSGSALHDLARRLSVIARTYGSWREPRPRACQSRSCRAPRAIGWSTRRREQVGASGNGLSSANVIASATRRSTSSCTAADLRVSTPCSASCASSMGSGRAPSTRRPRPRSRYGDPHARHADVVVEPVGLALEQASALRPRAPARSPRPRLRRPRWRPCRRRRRRACRSRGAVGHVDDRLVARLRGELAVAVVLADEDHRQLVQRRHVRGFVERAFVRGAVAEEADRDVVVLRYLFENAAPTAIGGLPPTMPFAPSMPRSRSRDVHAAALALAVAGRPAEQLRVHLPEVAAFGDEVAVSAVGPGDLVGVGEVDHDAGGDGLLPDIEVQRARDLRRLHELARFFLEDADANHPPVDVEQLVAIRGVALSR